MIRRDAPDAWLLISQVEHARIAAEIAEAWGNDQTPTLPLRDQLVAAVRHHDDGWAEWEAAPTRDPATGRPRDFLEMPLPEATAIWTRSIDACGVIFPWCGLWVSRHFCRLAERAHEHRAEIGDRMAASSFVERQADRQQVWRARLATAHSPDLEEVGFRWLRFFDLFSLWLCCAERTAPATLTVPGVPPLEVVPLGPTEVGGDPYPLRSESMKLSVAAVTLPRRAYDSDDDLRRSVACATSRELSWTIRYAASSTRSDPR
jgi:hypothetical protein